MAGLTNKGHHGTVILKKFSNPVNFVEHTHLPFKSDRILNFFYNTLQKLQLQ
jgi:hypothetical protein